MTRTFRITSSILAALSLVTLLACGGGGGGGGASNATTLSYTNPTTGTYRLEKAASSSASHLILNLVGPEGTELSGVGFYVNADSTAVTWAAVNGSQYVSSAFFTNAPVVGSKVTGDELQAGVYQKGAGAAFQTIGTSSVLATIALDLQANVPHGTAVSLTTPASKAQILNQPGSGTKTTDITLSVGTLIAN